MDADRESETTEGARALANGDNLNFIEDGVRFPTDSDPGQLPGSDNYFRLMMKQELEKVLVELRESKKENQKLKEHLQILELENEHKLNKINVSHISGDNEVTFKNRDNVTVQSKINDTVPLVSAAAGNGGVVSAINSPIAAAGYYSLAPNYVPIYPKLPILENYNFFPQQPIMPACMSNYVTMPYSNSNLVTMPYSNSNYITMPYSNDNFASSSNNVTVCDNNVINSVSVSNSIRVPYNNEVITPSSVNIGSQPSQLLQSINQVQFVNLVEPAMYKCLGKREFRDFLQEFETYLTKSGNVNVEEERKLNELKKFVEPCVKNKIDCLNNSGINYAGIIDLLVNDINRMRKGLNDRFIEQFEKLVRNQGETFEMLACRIESEGQRAYPELKITSDTLNKKLIIKLLTCGISEMDTFRIQQIALSKSVSPVWNDYKIACKTVDDNVVSLIQPKLGPPTYPRTYAEIVTHNGPPINKQVSCNFSKIPGMEPYPRRPLSQPGMVPYPAQTNNEKNQSLSTINIKYDRSCLSQFPCFHCKAINHNLKYCPSLRNLCKLCGSNKHQFNNCSLN